MRVVVDARPALDPRRTGVGRYADRLIRELPRVDPEAGYTAWYLHARGLVRPRRFFADVTAPNFREVGTAFPARLFEPLASRLGLPRLEWLVDFDVLLATNFLPPATASPGVVLVVHDLAHERYPETAPHIGPRWRARFEAWLARAARVIVPSAAVRRDLVAHHAVDPARVDVVPHGVDVDAFRPPGEAVDAVRRRFAIRGRYLLFLGGLEPRKNLGRLVRAFGALQTDATLVLAGGAVRWAPGEQDRLRAGVRERVVFTGYVNDGERAALLAGATALVYPSLHEGFGLPVLEAMAAGTPVLASNVSSLPEVAGDAALLVDPADPDALAAAMARLLEDEGLRGRLREMGWRRAAGFTWEQAARRTAATLHRAAVSLPAAG